MRVPDPTIEQVTAFFTALYAQLGFDAPAPFIYYSAGALLAWIEDPSRMPEFQRDTLEALQIGRQFYAPDGVPTPDGVRLPSLPTFRNRLGELQLDEVPELYTVAREVNHKNGFPWTDPRTGVTYPPPEKK